MARTTRDSKLDSRTARAKLTVGTYHWRGLDKGLALGYRKGARGGAWTVRYGLEPNKYVTKRLGIADDLRDPDGVEVLDFYQAQTRAREFAAETARRASLGAVGPYTVADATRDYLEWFAAHRKALRDTRRICETRILPLLGERRVSELTTREIRQWHQQIAADRPRLRGRAVDTQPAYRRSFDPRARKATANRMLTVLKAILNRAWQEGLAESDAAWRKVKPFPKVDAPTIRYLSEAECGRLINACPVDFRTLVQAALYTGARYSELTRLRVGDLNLDAGAVLIRETKSGRPRHVPLTEEGSRFPARLGAGRKKSDLLLVRDDGGQWGHAHQTRRMVDACRAVAIEPAVSFHVLRHTYGSALAMKGVPLQVIAAALGHADTRITERHYAHLQPSYVADTLRANLPDLGAYTPDGVVRLPSSG